MTVPEEVHVWKVPLAQPPEVVSACRQLLSPEELQRAAAFHFEKDRRRYTVARGALRLILAGHLGAGSSAQGLAFGQGPHGKPHLAGEPTAGPAACPAAGAAGPQFNLSHCEDLALVAVAAERPVGVDVERIRSLSDLRSIQERFFSPEEREYLALASEAERARAFLTLWTRREAAAKALGLDLQAALAEVKIPLYPPGDSVVLTGLPEPSGAGPWSLRDLALGPEHVGAVCVQGSPCTAFLHEFVPSEFL